MIELKIPSEYGSVLLVALTICFQVTMIGFIKVGVARKNCFHYEVVSEFEKIHEKQLGCPIDSSGYPDNGSGRYYKKMNYRDWYTMNFAQHTHMNQMNFVFPIVMMLLIAGLKYPT